MFIPTFLLNFVKIYNNLDKIETIKLIHKDFNNKKGIYGIKCNVTKELYIGSAENIAK